MNSPKGEQVSLGSDTDMWTRLETIEKFGNSPEQYRRYWAFEYSGYAEDPNRIVHGTEGRGPKR